MTDLSDPELGKAVAAASLSAAAARLRSTRPVQRLLDPTFPEHPTRTAPDGQRSVETP